MRALLALVLMAAAAHADPAPPSLAPPLLTAPEAATDSGPHTPKLTLIPPPPNARTEAWISTGVTAVIVGFGAYSVYRMHEASIHANNIVVANGTAGDLAEYHAATQENDRWHTMTYAFSALMVVSAGVTAYMWSRTETRYQLSVTPQGATVGYATSF